MFKKKRITLLTSEFPPGPGGIGNHAWNLSRHLYLKGYKIVVVTDSRLQWKKEEIIFDIGQPFKVMRAESNSGRLIGRIHRLFLFWSACNHSGLESLILVSGKFPLWFAGVFKAIHNRHRILGILHGSEVNPRGYFKRLFTKWSLKKCDHLVAVSNFTRSIALQLCSDLKIEVIPNGFEIEKLTVPVNGKVKGTPALVTVGSVSPRKGQHKVAEALLEIRKTYPNVHYHVVGIPVKPKLLQETINRHHLQNYVTIYGALPDENMVQILKGSDVFLMLSTEQKDGDVEGFGIAVLEANAVGLPVIGSLDCGLADSIADGQSGKLVKSSHPCEVLSALQEILNNYQVYSKKAIQWSAQFHWEKIIQRYLDIIEN